MILVVYLGHCIFFWFFIRKQLYFRPNKFLGCRMTCLNLPNLGEPEKKSGVHIYRSTRHVYINTTSMFRVSSHPSIVR